MTRRSLSPSHLEVWSPAQDPYTSYLTPRSTARACHLVYSASADREVERLHQVRAMLENAVVECGRSGPFHERSGNEEEDNEHHLEEGSWRSPSLIHARSSPPKTTTTTTTTAATTNSMSSKRGVSFRGFDVDVSYQPSILDDGGSSTARAAADGLDNGGMGGGSAESNGPLLEGEPQEVELEGDRDAADGDWQAGLPSTSQDPRAHSLMTTNSSPSAGGSHDLAACSSSFSSPALLGIGDTRRHSSLVAFNAATSLLVTRQFESIGRKECLYMEMVDRHELYQQFSRRLRRLERHAFDQEQRALLFIVQKQNADAMTLRAEASANLQELESRHRCALEQMLTEKITIFSEASRSLQSKVQFVETTTAMFVIMTAETEARRRIEADELFAAAPASPSDSQVMEGDDGCQPAGAEQGQDPLLVVLQEGRSRIALHELAARLEISYREKNRLHHAETVADRARQLQQHHHHHEVENKEDVMTTNDRIILRAGVQKAKSLEEVLSATSLSVQSLQSLMAPPVGMKGDADDPVATFAGAARGNQPTPTRKPYGRVPSPTSTAAAHQRSGSPATALPLRPIPRSPSAGRRSPARQENVQPKAQYSPVERGRAPSPPVAPATGMGNSTRTSPLPPAAPPLRAPSPTAANTAKSLQQFARVRPQSPPRSDPQQQQQKSETVALPVNSSSSSTARRNSAVTSPAARKSMAGRTPSPTAATKPKSNPSPPPSQSPPSPTPLTTQPPRSTGGSASSAHRGTDVTRTRSPANTLSTANNTPSRTLDDEEEEEGDHKVAGRRSSSGNPAVIAVGSPMGDGVVITDELLAAAEVDSDGDDDDDDDGDLDHRSAAEMKSAQTATASASPQRQRTISMRARRDVAAAQRRAMLSFLQRSLQASASKQQLQQGAGNCGSPAGSSRNLRLVRAPSSLALPPPTLPYHGWLLRCSTGAHVGWNRRYFCVTRTGKLRMTNADPQEAIEQYLRRMRKQQQQQAPFTAVHDVPNVLTLVKWTTLARVEHITDVDFDCCTTEKCGGARLPPHVESSHGFVVDLRVGEEGQHHGHHHASVNVVSRIRLCCYSKKDRNEWVQTLRRVVQLTKEFHVQEQ